MRHKQNVAKPPKRRRRGGHADEIFRPEHLLERTTPSARTKVASRHFMDRASSPPFQGGENTRFQFIHTFIDRPYRKPLVSIHPLHATSFREAEC